ncbi:MAG: universal stress protein, partial [Rhizobium pusense]|nr:universal stress protein [Agrobacterium pusense]
AASLVFDNPTVMIAWQEPAEASSAVRASVPLLKLAGSVHIVIVDDNRDLRDPAPGLLSYLSSRGVENLSAEVVPRNDRLVSHVLDDHAERVGANLVVMGAYGHARLREWVFGGVTRSVVQHLTRPTFMAR